MQLYKIVFSPTGGTQKVADIVSDALVEALGVTVAEQIDLANPFLDESDLAVPSGDLAIIAMPCFGGRAPEVAMKRLSRIKGFRRQGSRHQRLWQS